jgi:putative acetyltransferase
MSIAATATLHKPGLNLTGLTIRPVEARDNVALQHLVPAVLREFVDCSQPGYASSDPELMDMHGNYQAVDSRYWVVSDDETGHILGGAGFSRLKGTTEEDAICELQKLYFLPELRGRGIARHLVERSIEEATRLGYRHMYLETIPPMTTAIAMYEKFGFKKLPVRMGATGHSACSVFMLRPLAE